MTHATSRRGIVLDRSSPVPLNRQLEDALREAILAGRLKPGERILSSRELCAHLGVSRNTVVTALDQLHAEGYLTFVRGVGAFVAQTLHQRVRVFRPSEDDEEIVPSDAAAAFMSVRGLSTNLHGSVPFRPGIPALDLFPATQFRRAFNARQWSSRVFDYPQPLGDERLREAIGRRLQQTRGVSCTPDQILIVGGAQAAISLITRVLVRKNDTVAVEEPGYPTARAIFLAQGARLAPVPVDEAGIDVNALPRRRTALAYLTPSHQYPTGAVLSLERRFAALEWAERENAWIVEDDYDSEFAYGAKPQPALHGLDGGRRVLYLGTFSKVLSPALRVAYVVVPRALRAAFEAAQRITGAQPSGMLQSALAAFMESGQLGRHITKMRSIYDERRSVASHALAEHFGEDAVIDSKAGLHFVLRLPKRVRDVDFSARAASRGIIIPALSGYFHGRPTQNGIVVGYAAAAVPAARKAIALLVAL